LKAIVSATPSQSVLDFDWLTNPSLVVNTVKFEQQFNQPNFGLDLNLDTSQTEPDHDDSGIGMSGLMDDGLDLKYSMAPTTGAQFVSVSTNIR
jgi:regulatory factor X